MMSNVGDPDLVNALNDTVIRLDNGIKNMFKTGKAYASANHDYKVAVYEEAYRMKAAGETMTMINIALKGSPKVAPLLLERDTQKVLYDAALETINILKLKAKLLEAQIDREYRG